LIFGSVALDDALGCVLAHTQRLPGLVLKKGSVLDAAGVAALRAAGQNPVIAATLEPGDVAEDEAATRLADALLSDGLDRTRAGTGRVNLVARRAGLLRVDVAAVDALNGVDEVLTLATLPDWASVAAGEMVATIKVIPFAVAGVVLGRAVAAAGPGALRLHPYRALTVGLVMSKLPGLKPSVLAGTAEATRARVEGLGGTMLPPFECAHEAAPIAAALAALMQQGADILLVAGASAVVDRRDVGPAGIVAAGGAIQHFGMPVDPGNLICLGRIGDRPALVLPGCARSPKLNGIDWVLSRLFAGVPVDGRAIAGMGVGGLLKDVGARPLPRAKAAAGLVRQAGAGVAVVVLAAGGSRRMAPRHKLLVPGRDGRAMVARVVDNLLATPNRPVIVVTGHRAEEVKAALAGRPVTFVHSPEWDQGLSQSLKAGIAAVPAEARAAIVCLGDMPLVTARTIERLMAAYDPDEGRAIVVPSFQGELGNPVLWDRSYFAAMTALSGDRGARGLLEQHADQMATVAMDDDAVLRDVDTPAQLESLPGFLQPA